MHTVRDQFSAQTFGLDNGSEWAWCAMEQGPHGIEAMSNMRYTEFYRLLRLFIGSIGMAHAHGNSRINKTADYSCGPWQLRCHCKQA